MQSVCELRWGRPGSRRRIWEIQRRTSTKRYKLHIIKGLSYYFNIKKCPCFHLPCLTLKFFGGVVVDCSNSKKPFFINLKLVNKPLITERSQLYAWLAYWHKFLSHWLPFKVCFLPSFHGQHLISNTCLVCRYCQRLWANTLRKPSCVAFNTWDGYIVLFFVFLHRHFFLNPSIQIYSLLIYILASLD